MHLVPTERAHLRTVDEHRACDAIAGLGEPGDVGRWAAQFGVLADPTRLALLLAIRHAPDIGVTDLAVAIGAKDTAVSQALRLLRTAGLVSAHRVGRTIRYCLTDDRTRDLLDHIRDCGSQPRLGRAQAALSDAAR